MTQVHIEVDGTPLCEAAPELMAIPGIYCSCHVGPNGGAKTLLSDVRAIYRGVLNEAAAQKVRLVEGPCPKEGVRHARK
jgi:hypothetical protein